MKPTSFLMIAALSVLGTFGGLRAQDGTDGPSDTVLPEPPLTATHIERGVEISNGKQTEALVLIFGLEQSYGRMPWGTEIFVRPDLIIVAAVFPSSGTVRMQAALPTGDGGDAPDGSDDGNPDGTASDGPVAVPLPPFDVMLPGFPGIWMQALALNLVPGVYELFRSSNHLLLPLQ